MNSTTNLVTGDYLIKYLVYRQAIDEVYNRIYSRISYNLSLSNVVYDHICLPILERVKVQVMDRVIFQIKDQLN